MLSLRHAPLLGLAVLMVLAAAPAGRPAVAAPAVEHYAYLPLVRKPPPPPSPPPPTFIGGVGSPIDGLNGLGYYPGNLDQNPPLRAKSFRWMRAAGVNYFRNYGSDSIIHSWRFVQPAQGVFYWAVWDQLVQAAQQEGIHLLATIGNGVPQWANGSESWRDKPLDLWNNPWESTSWYQYVRAFVERYDGDGLDDMPGLTQPVRYYEFYNEPDLRTFWDPSCNPNPERLPICPAHQFNGTIQDYARLTQVGYDAVKDADPTATVVGPATAQAAGNPDYFEYFIWNWYDLMNAGGLNFLDVVSFTRYMNDYLWDYDGNQASYVDLMLDHTDNTRGGKPVWFTETGWGAPSGDPSQYKAVTFVRFAVIAWQRPFVDKFFWYSFHEPQAGFAQKAALITTQGGGSVGVEPDPLLEPLFLAMDVFEQMTAPYPLPQRPVIVTQTPTSRVYRFENADGALWVAWHRDGTGSSVVNIDTGGRTVRKVGLLGEDLGLFAGGEVTLGPRPIYLTTRLDWNPNQGRITGRVRTSLTAWNNGLAGVTVQITGPVNTSTTTDSDGNYVFAGLPEGNYTVTVPDYTTTPLSRGATVSREVSFGRTSFVVDP